jgi:hypothetical protein
MGTMLRTGYRPNANSDRVYPPPPDTTLQERHVSDRLNRAEDPGRLVVAGRLVKLTFSTVW